MPVKPISVQEIREHAANVERSERFYSVVRQRQILSFMVKELLAGRGDTLTESLIAKEVFANTKGVVAKVEISRLRTILGEYYGTEGQFDPLRISIPRRTKVYTPEFSRWPPDGQEVTHRPEIDTEVVGYITTPPLPAKYVPLSETLASLRRLVLADYAGSRMPVTAIHGMGGVGKSVLAKALCGDKLIRKRFPDGIAWISIGKDARHDIVSSMREVAKAIGDRLDGYDTPQGCSNQFRTKIRTKAALIVLDDVWRASDLAPFLAEAPLSHLVYTSRDTSLGAALGAREYMLDPLDEKQSREMLSRWSGYAERDLPDAAREVIRECHGLALALSIIGAMLAGRPEAMWTYVHDLLKNADLKRIQADFPDYPDANLFRVMEISVDTLDAQSREHYLALAVLLEDVTIHPLIQQQLWHAEALEATATAERFISLSLATRDGEGIRLHDLQLDYVRAKYPDRIGLELILDAVRLSSIIDDDPSQFASQMLGRLLGSDSSTVRQFTASLGTSPRYPWLRPMFASLHAPGQALVRTLEGHSGLVNAVAISPEGRWIVSTSQDKTLKVWDLETGKDVLTIEDGHSELFNSVAISPDGRWIVSGSSDGTLKVWQLDGKEVRTFKGDAGLPQSIAITPDCDLVVSASANGIPKIWEFRTGKEVGTLEGHTGPVTSIAITSDGRWIVGGSGDNMLSVWELKTGEEVRRLEGHSGPITSVALSPDGRRIISASLDKTLKVWELETGEEIRTLQGHSGYVEDVATSSDGRWVVSGSNDQTIKVWELETGRKMGTLRGHFGAVTSVVVSPDGRWIVSAARDRTLKLWNLRSILASGDYEARAVQHGRSFLNNVSPETLVLWDRTRKLWSLMDNHLPGFPPSPTGNAVALSSDGNCTISAFLFDKVLTVTVLESGEEVRRLEGHSDAITSIALSPDGRWAVSASWDQTLKVWELETGKELRTLVGHSAHVVFVAITPDGRWAVSASWDQTLKVWELETGKELRTLKGHSDFVTFVAISPNGRWIVSASYDQTLIVWDLIEGRRLNTLTVPTHGILDVSISPDGRWIVAASHTKHLIVWTPQSTKPITIFTSDAPIFHCAFVDDQTVVASDSLGHIHTLVLQGTHL